MYARIPGLVMLYPQCPLTHGSQSGTPQGTLKVHLWVAEWLQALPASWVRVGVGFVSEEDMLTVCVWIVNMVSVGVGVNASDGCEGAGVVGDDFLVLWLEGVLFW